MIFHADREALQGMTTNERLMVTGLMDAFEEAVEKKDLEKMRTILSSVYIDEPSIEMMIRDASN